MPHFFISYAKKDTRELALQLNEALNKLPNVTSWVDSSLKAGQSWELQIQKEIDRCDYMIVLYSPDINRHKNGQEESYILREIHYAKRIARKQIIPVMVQITEPPMSLVMEQYIDFTIQGLRFNDLITAICNEAGILGRVRMSPSANLRSKSASDDLMPDPFIWIDIPNKSYSIAKYPVTNSQFAQFVEANGYNERRWWTESGWEAKLSGWNWDTKQSRWVLTGDEWVCPHYWTDSKWNGTGKPVVGVSWYEAIAFCSWQSYVTGESIILPTEEQWQYAAQGEDGRAYPWGNDWDGSRCNNSVVENSIGKTTTVWKYEQIGDSPFGVVDMAGNVSEWCVANHDDSQHTPQTCVLCGGSWYSYYSDNFRCTFRDKSDPRNRYSMFGFRISRLI